MHVIRMLRKNAGLSQEQLARALHVNQTTISKWENQQVDPDVKTLERLAEIFDVPVYILLNRLEDPTDLQYGVSRQIPLFSDQDDFSPTAKGPLATLPFAVSAQEKEIYFAYCLQDDSMAPEMKANDIVIIRRDDAPPSGAIVLAAMEGKDTFLRKLQRNEAGLLLLPLNNAYEPIFVGGKDLTQRKVKFYGKVTELRRQYSVN